MSDFPIPSKTYVNKCGDKLEKATLKPLNNKMHLK